MADEFHGRGVVWCKFLSLLLALLETQTQFKKAAFYYTRGKNQKINYLQHLIGRGRFILLLLFFGCFCGWKQK